MMTGKGKKSWTDGSSYSGSWEENRRYGKAKYTWSSGNYFKGHFDDGVRNGKGMKRLVDDAPKDRFLEWT